MLPHHGLDGFDRELDGGRRAAAVREERWFGVTVAANRVLAADVAEDSAVIFTR